MLIIDTLTGYRCWVSLAHYYRKEIIMLGVTLNPDFILSEILRWENAGNTLWREETAAEPNTKCCRTSAG